MIDLKIWKSYKKIHEIINGETFTKGNRDKVIDIN